MVAHTPENQYNELKHKCVKASVSFRWKNVLWNSACVMQIDLGSPVEPEEQAITAICVDVSSICKHLIINKWH